MASSGENSSPAHRHDHKIHVSQFRSRLESIKKSHRLHRINNTKSSFEDWFLPELLVTQSLLKKEYIEGLLQDVTEHQSPSSDLIDRVYNECPITFAILLEIGEGEYIERIAEDDESWDRSLPWTSKPTYLPENVWLEFNSVQRRFKPKELQSSVLSFDHESIIPFTSVSKIEGSGPTAQIYRATLHKDYDRLHSQRQTVLDGKHKEEKTDKAYAVKTYLGRHKETYFNAETEIFSNIRGNKHTPYPTGLVEFFGAYRYNGGEAYCVLLELATGGTIRQMFMSKEPPTNGQQIYSFWALIFELFEGLTSLHELQVDDSTTQISQCIHHDIHPDNIILIPGEDDNPTEASKHFCLRHRYVLADLGHASTVSVADASVEMQVPDPKAGREYAAPEVCETSEFESQLVTPVTAAVDIFSLGAVLIEAAVWLVKGPTGVKEFVEKRTEESKACGAEGPRFHDGSQLLPVVQDSLEGKWLRRHIGRSDTTTLRVIEHVIEDMLSPKATDRPRARDILKYSARLLRNSRSAPAIDVQAKRFSKHGSAEDIVSSHNITSEQARQGPAAQSPGHGNGSEDDTSRAPSVHQSSDTTPAMTPRGNGKEPHSNTPSSKSEPQGLDGADADNNKVQHVSVHDVLACKQQRKRRWFALSSSIQLRREHEMNRLRGRRMIFILDDSYKMGEDHRISILDTLEAMLYVVGRAHPASIELYFTNDMTRHRCRTPRGLLKLVSSRTFRNKTDMKASLSVILASCKDKLRSNREPSPFRSRSEGTSIFVLTDGIWESDDNVKPVVIRCAEFLHERRLGRAQICLSFITFGANSAGMQRIAELDDLKEVDEAPLDFVDRESHQGSFWKCLIGSLDPEIDAQTSHHEVVKKRDTRRKIAR